MSRVRFPAARVIAKLSVTGDDGDRRRGKQNGRFHSLKHAYFSERALTWETPLCFPRLLSPSSPVTDSLCGRGILWPSLKPQPEKTAKAAVPAETTETTVPIDRTKSVVRQGGSPNARPTRTPGVISRPQQGTSKPASPKDFITDTITELKRVVWPTKEERISGTIVTIGLLLFFAIYIAGLDSLARVVFVGLGILPSDTLQ